MIKYYLLSVINYFVSKIIYLFMFFYPDLPQIHFGELPRVIVRNYLFLPGDVNVDMGIFSEAT